MVYASIKEAWGIDDLNRKPPDNPYVVKDPIQNTANFKSFQKTNFRMDDLSEADLVPNKKNKRPIRDDQTIESTLDNDTIGYDKNTHRQYFLDKNDEYSEISSDDYSIASSEQIRLRHRKIATSNNLRGKISGSRNRRDKSAGGNRLRENTKPIIKNIHEGFQNHSHRSHSDNCSSMLEHLRDCRICRRELEEYSKNTFIKEFIIFSGSGIIMFLFLDLLRKIAQRSQ